MRTTRAILTAALFLGLTLSAGAADLETARAGGKIHTTVRAAIGASSLDFTQPLLFEPLPGEQGADAQVVRVTGMTTGEVEHVRLVPGYEIGRPDAEEMSRRYAWNQVGGSKRCAIYLYDGFNYSGLLQLTDMDWNNLNEIVGVNDRISSLKTGCNPVWFHATKNFAEAFGNDYLYVPAYTNMANVGSMNNHISSFRHDLP